MPERSRITAKRALADMDQREPDLTVKESELAGQLIIERTNRDALNKRLDDIEQEDLVELRQMRLAAERVARSRGAIAGGEVHLEQQDLQAAHGQQARRVQAAAHRRHQPSAAATAARIAS